MLLPELEGWLKLAGAGVAVMTAILVPVRSWIIEERRFRSEVAGAAERRRMEAARARRAERPDGLPQCRLSEAVNRLGFVLERLVEQGGRHDRSVCRLGRILKR